MIKLLLINIFLKEFQMSNRIIWIDFIKVFSMLAVIILHAASPILYRLNHIDMGNWMAGNIYEGMVRMAVPLFFMVSGVLLLGSKKQESLIDFFKKRFSKVVIPLLVWSLVYILITKYSHGKDIDIFTHILYSFNKPQYYHLWFMYAILGIYLILPILKIFMQNSTKELQWYFVGLWFVVAIALPFFNHFHFIQLWVKSHLPMMVGYMGYLVLGYLLSQIKLNKKIFFIALFFIVLASFGTIYGTYTLSMEAGKFKGFFHGNFGLFTFTLAVGYFIVLRYIGEKVLVNQHKISSAITMISATSLGIYLVHPIFLRVFNKIGFNVFAGPAYLMIPAVAFVTLLCSFIVIYLIQKIPVVKQIAP